MTENNSSLPTLWQPSEFKGSDLLPVEALTKPPRESQGSLDNVDAKDMVLPRLQLLQGMSKQVTEGLPGASPGKFFLSSTDEVLEGPVRVLLLFYHKSRSLFPDERKKEHAGLESCYSREGFIGTRYGDCFACDHKEWHGPKGARIKPACQEYHNFVVLTKNGPALLKVGGTSFPAGSKLMSGLKNDLSCPELWDFPCVLRAVKEATWHKLDISLDRKDPTPPIVRAAAAKFHADIKASHHSDRLHDADASPSNTDSTKPVGDYNDIPF